MPASSLGMDMADPAVSSTAVRHLFGTVIAMTNTPAGAASLGVLARAQMRVMVCSTPCVVPAQRIATDSTASPRQRVYTRYKVCELCRVLHVVVQATCVSEVCYDLQ